MISKEEIKNMESTLKAGRITGAYFVLGVFWIKFSDSLFYRLFNTQLEYTNGVMNKWIAFIAFTTIVLFFELRRALIREHRFRYSLEENNRQLKALSSENQRKKEEAIRNIKTISKQNCIFNKMLNGVNLPIVIWKLDGSIYRVNKEFEQLVQEQLGVSEWNHWCDLNITECKGLEKRINQIQSNEGVVGYETKIGNCVINWNDQVFDMGKYFTVLSIGKDITQERVEAENARRLISYDNLTNLYNRNKFDYDFEVLKQLNEPFYLLHLDVDEFKNVNDFYGYELGDQVLVELSGILKELFHQDDVYRWLGDEFIVLSTENSKSAMLKKMDEFYSEFRRRWQRAEFPIKLNFCMGVVKYPRDGSTVNELLRNADLATRSAKKTGKSKYVSYNSEMYRDLEIRVQIHRELDEAIDQNKLRLKMQPVYNLKTRKTVGVEALLRWESDEINVSTGELIAIAEESDLIKRIDRWVIDRAFGLIKDKPEIFGRLTVAINLSSKTFNSNRLLYYIQEMVGLHQIDPCQVQFEITEHSIMDNYEDALDKMNQLKKMGFSLAVDDFGTKYSSLNYLSKLPFDVLKIDKSYVDKATSDEVTLKIVRSIIDLSHELGMRTVSEGIETMDQEILMQINGCDIAQGFLYARPMKIDELEKHLEGNS
jgi:diguanylate cyclase (GGDEF)-like protein